MEGMFFLKALCIMKTCENIPVQPEYHHTDNE